VTAHDEFVPKGRRPKPTPWGALGIVIAIASSGCSSASTVAATSAYRQVSLYRSASAHVSLAPDDAFEPAVTFLLERDDIEITDLNETHRQCTAVLGDRTLTFRVIAAGTDRSRLSMLVGGVDDANGSQKVADGLIRDICGHLSPPCEIGSGAP